MGGVEATVKLRGSGYHRPIVALTANALKEDREQSTLAGVDDYLTKPVDINRFNDVLKRYLKPVSISAQQPVPGDKDNSVATLDEDPEFQALLKQFEQELPMKLEDIQSALKAENWQELRSQVHKLKGLGTSFGYPEISEIAAKIQNSIVNGQFDAIGELTSKLYNSYYNSPRQSKLSSGF
jgi:HPt (histidine-containing phosphotransfer) domain-containing protein